MQNELQKLNDTLWKVGLPFRYAVIADVDEKYRVRIQHDGKVHSVSHPYSEQGTLRYIRMMIAQWRNA